MPIFAIYLAILLMNFEAKGVAIGLFIFAGLKFLLNFYAIQRAKRALAAAQAAAAKGAGRFV